VGDRDPGRVGPTGFGESVPLVVVGAGLTGLVLSRRLRERGVEHLLLEASDRCGGVVRTTETEGRILEHGPQRTRLTAPVASLVRELGLEGELVRVPPRHPLFVYRAGRLRRVPFTAGELARTDLLSFVGKLRLLAEPVTGPLRADETIGAFLARKLGREAYEVAAGPLFGGLFGSDPREMYARHALAAVLERTGSGRSLLLPFLRAAVARSRDVPAVSFRQGLEVLVRALEADAAGAVRLRTPVLAARPGTNEEGGGWALTIEGSGEASAERGPHRLRARHLVLTCPADAAADIIRDALPGVAGRLDRLHYNPLALVHLHGECGLEGLGYQVAFGEALRTRGATWNASALGRRGVHTAFLGGARDPEVVELDDHAIGRIARDEFRTVTGCDTRVLGVTRTRMPAWDRSWAALDHLPLPPGLHFCAAWESRPGIPGRVAEAEGVAERLGSVGGDPGG
jgi:protoporphyrinogen/coproporphyrinogen III oxidase